MFTCASLILFCARTQEEERAGAAESFSPRLPAAHHADSRRDTWSRLLPPPPEISGITKSASPLPTLKSRNLPCAPLRLALLPTSLLVSTLLMPEPHKRDANISYCTHLLQQPVRRSFWRTLPTATIKGSSFERHSYKPTEGQRIAAEPLNVRSLLLLLLPRSTATAAADHCCCLLLLLLSTATAAATELLLLIATTTVAPVTDCRCCHCYRDRHR